MTQDPAPATENGRNPLFVFVGFALLGVALTLVLFGGNLFAGQDDQASPEAPETVMEQVPQFERPQQETAELPGRASPLAVGDVAYDFALQDLDGNTHSLRDYRGQPVIINFWATWCAPCRVEMPELEAAFQKYQDQGLVILALDQDEPPEIVRSFFYDEMGLTFTPLLDERSMVSQLYGTFNFPSTYFVNPDGVVTAIHRGPMVQSQIEGYLVDTIPAEG